MFCENILLVNQQDLQLGPYFVKWRYYYQGWPGFPINQSFCKIDSSPNSYGGLNFRRIYSIQQQDGLMIHT